MRYILNRMSNNTLELPDFSQPEPFSFETTDSDEVIKKCLDPAIRVREIIRMAQPAEHEKNGYSEFLTEVIGRTNISLRKVLPESELGVAQESMYIGAVVAHRAAQKQLVRLSRTSDTVVHSREGRTRAALRILDELGLDASEINYHQQLATLDPAFALRLEAFREKVYENEQDVGRVVNRDYISLGALLGLLAARRYAERPAKKRP